ncbi:MAG: hypothetical protein J4478_03770 [Candidatus Diapherotrites archaeon]|nr:hypothetical protein [Candidatus Diapherotrites archaeon]
MLPVQELRFAQAYPFSKTAQAAVKNARLSLSEVSETVLSRARLMLQSSLHGKAYKPLAQESSDAIMNEVLAFPVAKILLSFSKNISYFERFAGMISENALKRLELEKPETLLDLASELNVEFELLESKDFFAAVSLISFLKIPQTFKSMRLVNQKLENGKVFLEQQEFARLLSEAVRLKVFQSLPVDVKGVPKGFQNIAFEIFSEASARQREFLKQVMHGEIEVEAFPPCYSELYAKINSGEKLTHWGNFALAAFLIALNMPKEEILGVFKKASNYDERIAKYHIERMSRGKKYTPPSCEKLRSFGLCIQNGIQCSKIKNPVQYYRRKLFSMQKPGKVEKQ